jgi:hypothetical protein
VVVNEVVEQHTDSEAAGEWAEVLLCNLCQLFCYDVLLWQRSGWTGLRLQGADSGNCSLPVPASAVHALAACMTTIVVLLSYSVMQGATGKPTAALACNRSTNSSRSSSKRQQESRRLTVLRSRLAQQLSSLTSPLTQP